MTDNERAKNLSQKIKNELFVYEIVTPEVFNHVYRKVLSEEPGVDEAALKAEVQNYIESRLGDIQSLSQKTMKSVDELDKTTSVALNAIKTNNAAQLQQASNEIQNLKQEVENLRHVIYIDELTKANNRKWLYDCLLNEGVFRYEGVIVMIDLNYFKEINDTLGHLVGDKALQYLSSYLQKTDGAKVVRYGGDEFCVIFEGGKNVKTAEKILEEKREVLAGKRLKTGKVSFRLSFAFGTAKFHLGEEFIEVANRADKKMYTDKKAIKQKLKNADIQRIQKI